MIPAPGQYVKVIFKYGCGAAEGFVSEWSERRSVLESEDGKSYFIIQNTDQDVVAVKITPQYRGKVAIKNEFEKIKEIPLNDPKSIQNIADLKIELNRLEREDLANKLHTHEFSNIQPVKHVSPFNTAQSRPLERPAEKNIRKNIRISPMLSRMLKDQDKNNR